MLAALKVLIHPFLLPPAALDPGGDGHAAAAAAAADRDAAARESLTSGDKKHVKFIIMNIIQKHVKFLYL